jgi:2-dehydropantoate 2-reductase
MHFVILGAGALGSLLAAHLARAGHQVDLIARGGRATVIADRGLSIRGLNTFEARCAVVRDPAAIVAADVFINTVKTYDSVAGLAALHALRPRLALSVQNGVVKEDELCAQFGAEVVLGAMADFSGELTEQGAVLFTRNINLHLGARNGTLTPRVQELAAAIHDAGINARAVDNIDTIIWSKYCGWVALMLLAVLTRRYTGDYLQDPAAARVVVQITRETTQLARQRRIPLLDVSPMPVVRMQDGSEEDAVAVVQEVGARMAAQAPTHRLSSLQDLLRGRRLELEETVGHAYRQGLETGLAMPALATCYRIAAAINRGMQ